MINLIYWTQLITTGNGRIKILQEKKSKGKSNLERQILQLISKLPG